MITLYGFGRIFWPVIGETRGLLAHSAPLRRAAGRNPPSRTFVEVACLFIRVRRATTSSSPWLCRFLY